jgi:hypothetical protein
MTASELTGRLILAIFCGLFFFGLMYVLAPDEIVATVIATLLFIGLLATERTP